MFGIGLGELILIIIVALLFISPEKLPEIAGSVVKAYREIRRAGNEFKRSVTDIEGVPSPKKDAERGGVAREGTGQAEDVKEKGKGAQGGVGEGGEGGVGGVGGGGGAGGADSGRGNTGSSAS